MTRYHREPTTSPGFAGRGSIPAARPRRVARVVDRLRLPSTLVLLAALVAGCASTRQGVVPSAPESGGSATGSFVVGGEETPLVHAYVVAGDATDPGARDRLRIILSDRPVHAPALADRRLLAALVAAGDARAVEVLLDEDGRATTAYFFHDALPAGLSVIEHTRFLPRGVGDGRLAGSVIFDDPGFSFGFAAKLEAPIYRLPAPPEIDLPSDATPAQRARAEIEARGLLPTVDEFNRQVRFGDGEAVELFLAAGIPAPGTPALDAALDDAVVRRHPDVVRQLLAAGADSNQRRPYGSTLLMRGVDTGDPEIVIALLDGGAEVDAANDWQITALASAAEQGYLEIVEALLAAGADPDRRNTAGGTALSVAVLRGYAEIVETLIDAGADVQRDREALLELARERGDAEIEELLRQADD